MATRTATSDLDPKAVAWMQRATDEDLRHRGRFRDLVLRMLARDEEAQPEANGVWQTRVICRSPSTRPPEPTLDELAAAMCEPPGAPFPPVLVDYVARVLRGRPRKTGPHTPRRSTWDDLEIIIHYQQELRMAQAEHKADDSPATRKVKTHATARTAKKYHLSPATIGRILAPRPLPRTTPLK